MGVAVKEGSTLSSVKSKKKKRRRKRSGSTSSVDVLPLPTADDNNGDVNDIDKQSSSSTKKKKRKKKKKKSNDDSIEYIQENVSTEDKGIQTTTTIAKQAPLKGNFIKERSNLPVYQHREEICNLVSKNDVVLVVAETVSTISFAFICNECIAQIILCTCI